ncbi:hypothetical protein [Paraburkholderia sp. SUR17]|uniref:hypothetical protein n=1 Tax=Paraburkholderia sp. SUR17 TaxID=3034358 RepID=UPI0024082396|nr:hypothetical protein [Paraburkholderia sp. SUR17]WEY37671.1 hypothetical protein P2869_11305 [Paraburkholderia sp. SUR17]
MAQNERFVSVSGQELADMKRLLLPDGTLNSADAIDRSWVIGQIDDKSLFNKDAQNLAQAFREQNAKFFLVARVPDLLSSRDCITAYRFGATKEEIETFQGPDWFEANLEDCLLFCLPISCAVLRPGEVDKTEFAGSAKFVERATLGKG